MTCKQLGGACDQTFSAASFEEIAVLSQEHGKEIYRKGDEAHQKAMSDMQQLMLDPKKMQQWFQDKRNEFEALKED